jgi:plasmid maintenance system antidote protein VapI
MQESDLLAQLAKRTINFKERTGLTSRQLSKLAEISEQSMCDFLANRKGLGAESLMRLMQVMSSNRKELNTRLGKSTTSQITHFQS